jgi:ABC-type multidrug transport system ATPase subunit
LAEPDFFIFDEATSALDTVSEGLVQRAMENAIAGKTALIIAHRLATVKNCDRILVIADGRIVQDGNYDGLVAQPGMFSDLVQGQVFKGRMESAGVIISSIPSCSGLNNLRCPNMSQKPHVSANVFGAFVRIWR